MKNIQNKKTVAPRVKPSWRGVLHQWAFPVSLLAGAVLVLLAPSNRARLAATIYAVSLSALLGTSALYHRVDWKPRARHWLARLDMTMIFALIAGSYTPIALLVLEGSWARLTLWLVWGAAGVGAAAQFLRWDWPKWATAGGCLAVGWIGVVALPDLVASGGVLATALLACGGLLYTAGAVVYALQRPDPRPSVFGYHEIFHAFVLLAASFHYAAIASYVLFV